MSALGRIWVIVPPLAEEMTKRRPGPLLTVRVATSFDTSFIDPTSVQVAGAVAAAALCTRSIRDFQSPAPSAIVLLWEMLNSPTVRGLLIRVGKGCDVELRGLRRERCHDVEAARRGRPTDG